MLSATDYAEIGLPVTEVYDTFAHKGGNQNWWLAQAKNGLIYNGTGTGLNEWDGENWSIYHTPQKSRIRSISIWKDDNIYIGTTNDIGYFSPNQSGILTYQSLLTDWSFEEKQLGEVWSVASNKYGVMFTTNKYLLFWDGIQLQKIDSIKGSHRIFSVDDIFYFKNNTQTHLYQITIEPEMIIAKTNIALDKNAVLRKIFRNNHNNFTLITASQGVYEVVNDKVIQKLTAQDFPENTAIYNGIQASDGYYYITTLSNGLFIVDANFKLVKNYTQEHGLRTDTLLSVIEDYQGNIWLSGVPNIVKMVPPHKYSHYSTEINSNSSEGIAKINNTISIIGDGIHQLNKGKSKSDPAYFRLVTNNKQSTWDVIEYKNKLIYAGTGGVYVSNNSSDINTSAEQNIIKTQFAKGLAIDDVTDTIFATSVDGLYRIRYKADQWIADLVPNTQDELHYIAIEMGIIWIGTSTQELYRVENAQYDDKLNIITKFNDKNGLGPNNVMPFKISTGIVFGTNDGLMNYKKDRNPQLQFLNNLPEVFHTNGLDVFRLYEDNKGNIWYRIGSKTGVMYKDKAHQWQTNEDMFRYFPDSGYKGFVKSEGNILWFSMANGDIFRANTNLIKTIPPQGNLNIRRVTNLETELEIYGGLGAPHLPTLSQENNSIRIQYALTDNSIANAKKSNQVLYRNRLLGSNNEKFSQWSSESQKDFTLLRGSDYTFEVEAKDAWGRISKKQISYTVLPPWYLSTAAWTIYALMVLLLLIISSWLTQKWRTKKLNLRNLELEKEVQERTADVQAKATELKQQQELKDRFFTNVSHEFRTPLTLTIAPLEAFLTDHSKLDSQFLHPIKTALRNSKKMLSLVGQVLDINRLESGRFPLHVAQYNLSELINNTANRFKILAQQNQQVITTINTQEPHLLYFDQDQLEKCISNLVANAIKYSGKNTKIEISVVTKDQRTGIQVSDNGKGISPSFENKIFERFTQDEESEQVTEPGTGIGLALVKELMELHHGKVELNNKPDKGCDFILWLSNGNQHFDQSQLVEAINKSKKLNRQENLDISEQLPISMVKLEGQDVTTILVVDDNHELREFIASRLSASYQIIQASNGQEGYNLAQSDLPDLIISDVMMPIMDGLELTQKLKANHCTKPIPIILLTAKSSKRETVEGLKSGADDYLTKPFDTSELIMRVNGLINNRKLIRETIKAELSQQITHLDKTSDFIDQLRHEIMSQLSDPALSVESISSALAMSRHSLNRKCKSELNRTTGQVITETRMQQALSLLKQNKHTVSEVAYGIGYDSLAYFSRTFKKFYGKTPSEIRNNV